MQTIFGQFVREKREALYAQNPRYSLRKVAARVGIQPSYLSKVERGDQSSPSEATILKLARDLKEDPDVMLALAGKVSSDLREVIRKRPQLFAHLIRELKDVPDHAVLKIVREVQDANR
ncbi:MAG: helix-turn-helix transcriptional regulator [Candidatus Sumerlaeota bacterium]|nr:helix-turn-helix transcriptional regulator [Candidatus Sumerlaeota bacterium]